MIHHAIAGMPSMRAIAALCGGDFLACQCPCAGFSKSSKSTVVSPWLLTAGAQEYVSALPCDAILVGERECLCRFLVLVTGTLVYGKGDKMEAKAEGLLGEGEERLFAPVATADPGQAQPAAVPGAHRRSSVGTAPIAMRATPGSLKARPAHPSHANLPCGPHPAPGTCRVLACAPHLLGSP